MTPRAALPIPRTLLLALAAIVVALAAAAPLAAQPGPGQRRITVSGDDQSRAARIVREVLAFSYGMWQSAQDTPAL